MPRGFSSPRTWSREELRSARDQAEGLFKDHRRKEGPLAFQGLYRTNEGLVRTALESTGDLRNLTGDVLRRHEPLMWGTLRYCCAPPVSEEDLWTLVGRKFKALPKDAADATAAALLDVLDSIRFPWVAEDRRPTVAERNAGVMATSALMTHEHLRTQRRGQSSKRQEDAVAAALRSVEYQLASAAGPREITILDHLERGCFSRERKIAGAKCDVPVRLLDGRLLALECKVSNGPKNSWKRLNREVGGKAERWSKAFGTQLLTGAVLAGVFDVRCLETAQESGVFLFWEHDLTSLTDFVRSCTPR